MSPLTAGPAVLEAALAAGARLFRETEVFDIERAGFAFVLHTSRGPVRAGRVLNAAGGWAPRVAAMLGVSLPVRASPIQLIVTETAPPLLRHLLAYADRHLTMKQMAAGNLVIGGGWPSELDPASERAPGAARERRGEPLGRGSGPAGPPVAPRHPHLGGNERDGGRRPPSSGRCRGCPASSPRRR